MEEIKNMLKDLENSYQELNNLMKETLLIEGKIIEEDKLIDIITNNQKVLDEVINVIIPMTKKI